MKILVTGSTGFVGSNIKDILNSEHDYIFVSSRDYNLENIDEFSSMIKDIQPNKIIHLAAYSGGIKANINFPADFYQRNLFLINNLYLALKNTNNIVENTIVTIGGCSYPNSKDLLYEKEIWNGFPQKDSAPYSIAKKTAIVASDAYKKQYGINSQIVIPANIFGKFDNFNLETSHVIPALIKKFLSNNKKIIIWGNGKPIRDFIYASDLARNLIKIVEGNYNFDVLNISSGKGVSINQVVKKIAKITKFKGMIEFDTTKPNGQIKKIFSNKLMKELGLSLETSINKALTETIDWYKKYTDD